MAQPATDEKSGKEDDDTWPASLLLNKAYAMAFICIKCHQIPKSCMNNDDGDIFCKKCSKDMDDVVAIKQVQNMINKLKTKCLSIHQYQNNNNKPNDYDNDEVEGHNLIQTQLKQKQCDWTGMIKEWKEHQKECQYIMVQCTYCHNHECPRNALNKHSAQCPEISVDCFLCGASILRKTMESHLAKDCNEALIKCSNDDCKEQVKRKSFYTHINTECAARMIPCQFVKYGCKVKGIRASEYKQHLEEYKVDHLGNKFDFMASQLNGKIDELTQELTDSKLAQSDTTNKCVQLKGKIDELQQNNTALTKELTDSKTAQIDVTNKLNDKIDELQQHNTVLTKELTHSKLAQTDITNKCIQLNGKIVELEENNDALRWALNDSESNQSRLNGKIIELSKELNDCKSTQTAATIIFNDKITDLQQRLQEFETKNDDEEDTKIKIIPLNLKNKWVKYADSCSEPKAIKISDMVYLQGILKGGDSKTIATLPNAWRPSKNMFFAQCTHGSTTEVAVLSDGDIYRNTKCKSFLSLDGIVFCVK